MDEISDLIRLLAEAPMEEPPMSRPKDLLDRIALERVVSEGVQPVGKAVPDAQPSNKIPAMGVTAIPAEPQTQIGATANPKTGVPDVPIQATVAQPDRPPGVPARLFSVGASFGKPASPQAKQSQLGGTAAPKGNTQETTRPAGVSQQDVDPGRQATAKQQQPQTGITANPRAGIPELGIPAGVAQFEPIPGRPAVPSKTEVVAGRTVNPRQQQPMKVGEARVFSPETMAGMVATPKILDTIAGLPAAMREKQSVTGQAQVTPRAQVTVTVPPNFPLNPKDIFTVVDDLIQLPPRQDVSGARDLRIPITTGNLESTESFVARSFTANEGNTSDLDRWHL